MLDLRFRPVAKPRHKRRVPKKVDRGKFSNKTIKEIHERDGYQCIKCGSCYIESIPHHVHFRSQGGLGIRRNGVTVCRDCHTEAHTYKAVRKWFEEWVNDYLDENGNRL